MRSISKTCFAFVAASLGLYTVQANAQALVPSGDATIRQQLCVGSSCADDPTAEFVSPGSSSIKISGAQTRLDFDDTSASGFPDNDWALIANDNSTVGAESFSINDISGGTVPFTIAAGARDNALFIDGSNQVGFGTSLPTASIDIVQGFPGIRFKPLFSTAEWNVTGGGRFVISNEELRDWIVSIEHGAPPDSLAIIENGFVGFGTRFPPEALTVRTGADNTDAFALFTAEGSGSDAGFLIRQFGVVPTTWEFRNQHDSGRLNVGLVGGNTPFKIDNTANNNLLRLGRNGLPGEVNITGTLVVNNTALNVPDYVFADDYALRPLAEVRDFITANSHLPDVPSEADIKANGVDMTAMQMTLLKKVEELTLYTLAQEDTIAMQQDTIAKQQAELSELQVMKVQMARIEALLSEQVK